MDPRSTAANLEIDLYGGYKGEIVEAFSYDVGVLTYYYPGSELNPKYDNTELYGAAGYGPACR